nr:unnamed protein product [Digitaria exilis]
MELLSTLSLLSLLLISILILVSSWSKKSRKRRWPPGPWGLPFLGSIHHLLTSQPHAALRDLADKYGPVMYLRLGQIDTVVISSPAAAQEVLQTNDLSFASRPSMLVTEIICYNNLDVGFSPYGPYWRALRKLCTVELLSTRRVRQLAPIRDRETMALLGEIGAAAGDGQAVNLSSLLISCANNITGMATFGDRCSDERKRQFLSAMDVTIQYGSGFCVSDLFPSLRFLDSISVFRLQRVHRHLDDLLDKIITECEARQKVGDVGGEDDLLSVMLRIRDEQELEFPINTTNIKAVVVDLFMAGTETTSAATEWVMSEFMKNPTVMEKAQMEVRQAFNNTSPREHEVHMDKLPYTRMMIKETMRLYPPVPLLLPRICRETCEVGGFEIAKGTRVIINAWAMARNPNYWEDAGEFMPERFENSMIDYRGTQFQYLPFGSGRRMCPGSGFAITTLEFIVARLLYYFDWSLPSGMQPEELDMDMVVGASARRKNQLRLMASPYNVSMNV